MRVWVNSQHLISVISKTNKPGTFIPSMMSQIAKIFYPNFKEKRVTPENKNALSCVYLL